MTLGWAVVTGVAILLVIVIITVFRDQFADDDHYDDDWKD